MTGLTERQSDCLRFIAGYQRAKAGVSPSLREICTGVGSSSAGSMSFMISRLAERGFLRCLTGRKRAIEVLLEPALPSLNGEPLIFIPFHDAGLAQAEQ